MFDTLKAFFIDCSNRFLNDQKNLILTGVSERCLCGSLMTIIRYSLDDSPLNFYHADIEYNRNFDGRIKTIIHENLEIINITCDLIIHSRGENEVYDNLIAIEMKRDTHPEDEKNDDRKRLLALTKDKNDSDLYSADGRTFPEHVCGYHLGVFYEISTSKKTVNIEYYTNGAFHSSFQKSF